MSCKHESYHKGFQPTEEDNTIVAWLNWARNQPSRRRITLREKVSDRIQDARIWLVKKIAGCNDIDCW